MRLVVVFLGLAGLLLAGWLGRLWLTHHMAKREWVNWDRLAVKEGFASPKTRAELTAFDQQAKGLQFLISGYALGLLGVGLANRGRRFSAAALLLSAALGPAVFAPTALIYTSGLALAGLLALTIKPRPPLPEPISPIAPVETPNVRVSP